MEEKQLADDCLAGAASLLRDEIDDSTWIGDLYLTPAGGETWDVNRVKGTATAEATIYVDTIAPQRFGAAQILAAYLIELHKDESNLPKEAKHSGQLLREGRSSDDNPKG
jgi:hypothetical protein